MAKIILTVETNATKATQGINSLKSSVQTLAAELNKVNVNKDLTAQLNALSRAMNATVNHTRNVELAAERLNSQKAQTAKLAAQEKLAIERTNTELAKQANIMNRTTAATNANTTAVKANTTSLGGMIAKFALWQIAATAIMKPLQMLRSGFDSLNETLVKTENTVIAFQRVIGKDISGEEIADKLYKIAQNYGQTFDNVQSIALDFARTGLSWEEALKATEAALLGVNTAELTAENAATGLIAVLQQYNLEAKDLESVIDKLNITQDNAAVTTDKLLAALQRTGSSAANANISLEETVALITALSAATGRSGQNLGTALNSLINYSRKDSALETFSKLSDETAKVVSDYRKGIVKANGETTNLLDIWRQVSKEMQNLKAEQADILDDYFKTAEGSALQNELDGELEGIYDKMSGVYDTANTFRKNYFIALLGNMDEVEASLNRMDEAAGYSQQQNKDYLESYQSKLNTLTEQWHELANSEQNFLNFKKGLVEMGSGLLTAMKYTGGLTTAVTALGGALSAIILKKYSATIATWAMSHSNLAKTINAQSIPSMQALNARIKSLKAEIFTTIDSEKTLALQQELLAAKTQKLTLAMQGLATAVTAVTIVFSVLNAIQGAIDQARADAAAAEEERTNKINESIAAANESIDKYKKEAESALELKGEIEDLRRVMESSTASEEEKTAAQNTLLNIQNRLIESNGSYAGSLDIVNGKLSEQLGLIEKLTLEQLKQQGQEWLVSEYVGIDNAEHAVNDTSSNTLKFMYDVGAATNSDHWKVISKVIDAAKKEGVDLSAYEYTEAPTAYSPILYYEELIRGAANGKKTSVWDWLGFTAVKDMFTTGEAWAGASTSGVTLSGTVDEQIEQLETLKKLLIDNYADFGLSQPDSVKWIEKIDDLLKRINDDNYKAAKSTAERADATRKLINDEISKEEYLRIVFGIEIEPEGSDKTEQALNKIQGKWDNIISKLKEYRDLNKEALTLQEKQLAVQQAERALAEAKDARGVKRVGESGRMEIQADEKKIAAAEDNLQKAVDALNKYTAEQAYKEIEALDEGNRTTERIFEILAKWAAESYGESAPDWLKEYIRIIEEESGETLPPISKSNTFDSGGIAYGKGIMVKDTERAEMVLPPDITAALLAPNTTSDFNAQLRNLGIMAETGRYHATPQPIYNYGGATTTNNYGNTTTVNGVQIGSDMLQRPFIEVLEAIGLVPNNK